MRLALAHLAPTTLPLATFAFLPTDGFGQAIGDHDQGESFVRLRGWHPLAAGAGIAT